MDTVDISKKTVGKQTLNCVEKVSLDSLLTNTTPHYTRSSDLQHTTSSAPQETRSSSQHYVTSKPDSAPALY